uniref:C3H1-type domain-containing protein n=1 Tax=Panagrellus redivivus TaxID=6233 RepID=A0A7E4ZQX2_PANRE
MVSAHPHAGDTAIRQPPKLGDFFSPYHGQAQQTQHVSSLVELANFDERQQRQMARQPLHRRSPLANSNNTHLNGVSRPQTVSSGNSSPNQENSGSNSRLNTANGSPKNPKLYKTELCRSWMDHGRCNYGERCQYAHGETEKRPIPRHPKYKTEACQSYHKTGYCPYGPRCHFIHNEEPAMLAQLIAQNAAAMATVTSGGAGSNGIQQQPRPRNLNLTASAPVSTVGTPAQAPGQNRVYSPSIMPIGSRPTQQQQQQCRQTSRFFPRPIGSDGESPVPSSTDSGSESPLGSFSPGLDQLDDSLARLSPTSFRRSLSHATTNHWSPTSSVGPFGVDFWQPVESPASSLSAFVGLGFEEPMSTWDSPSTTTTTSPHRLPVFERLSNNLA